MILGTEGKGRNTDRNGMKGSEGKGRGMKSLREERGEHILGGQLGRRSEGGWKRKNLTGEECRGGGESFGGKGGQRKKSYKGGKRKRSQVGRGGKGGRDLRRAKPEKDPRRGLGRRGKIEKLSQQETPNSIASNLTTGGPEA